MAALICDADPDTCPHPPARYYCWFAYDGTLCAVCCQCGKVLAGAYIEPEEDKDDQLHRHL